MASGSFYHSKYIFNSIFIQNKFNRFLFFSSAYLLIFWSVRDFYLTATRYKNLKFYMCGLNIWKKILNLCCLMYVKLNDVSICLFFLNLSEFLCYYFLSRTLYPLCVWDKQSCYFSALIANHNFLGYRWMLFIFSDQFYI